MSGISPNPWGFYDMHGNVVTISGYYDIYGSDSQVALILHPEDFYVEGRSDGMKPCAWVVTNLILIIGIAVLVFVLLIGKSSMCPTISMFWYPTIAVRSHLSEYRM